MFKNESSYFRSDLWNICVCLCVCACVCAHVCTHIQTYTYIQDVQKLMMRFLEVISLSKNTMKMSYDKMAFYAPALSKISLICET
jgi:hypothetical protein